MLTLSQSSRGKLMDSKHAPTECKQLFTGLAGRVVNKSAVLRLARKSQHFANSDVASTLVARG